MFSLSVFEQTKYSRIRFCERERQTLFQFTKASSGGVPVVVVLAVVSWDEDVGSTYNTHGRRRIFVKETVVSQDSARVS